MHHCMHRTHLQDAARGVVLKDTSTYGTYVNGIQVEECILQDNDIVALGTSRHFECVSPIPTHQPSASSH